MTVIFYQITSMLEYKQRSTELVHKFEGLLKNFSIKRVE